MLVSIIFGVHIIYIHHTGLLKKNSNTASHVSVFIVEKVLGDVL